MYTLPAVSASPFSWWALVRALVSRTFVAKPTPRHQPSWRLALLMTVILVGMAAGISSFVFRAEPKPWSNDDSHRRDSIHMALNWIVCGSYSSLEKTGGLDALLFGGARFDTPLRSLPAMVAGNDQAYCDRSIGVARNNENSLMMTMAALMWARPSLTLHQLSLAMHAVRVFALGLVVLAFLRSGASWVFGMSWATGALVILAAVERHRFDSVYPFLAPVAFGGIALAVLLVDIRGTRSRVRWFVASAVFGLLIAYAANFRSSYLPLLAAVVAIAAFTVAPGAMKKWQVLLLMLVGFAAGYQSFQRTFIKPIDDLPLSRNFTYHVVFHPLVLSLALPPNDLAEREGIAWDDKVGYDIASRVHPGVEPLSADYERALSDYYFGLWRSEPLSMVSIYWHKWGLALTDIPTYSSEPFQHRLFRLVLWPVRRISHGAVFSLGFSLLVAGAWLNRRKWTAAAVTAVAGVGAIGILLSLETTVILTYFYATHGASQALALYTLSLSAWQVGANLLAWPFRTST